MYKTDTERNTVLSSIYNPLTMLDMPHRPLADVPNRRHGRYRRLVAVQCHYPGLALIKTPKSGSVLSTLL